jgi:hypothetical protein
VLNTRSRASRASGAWRPGVQVALEDPKWTMDGVGEGDEKLLLQQFDKCTRVYQSLEAAPKAVIGARDVAGTLPRREDGADALLVMSTPTDAAGVVAPSLARALRPAAGGWADGRACVATAAAATAAAAAPVMRARPFATRAAHTPRASAPRPRAPPRARAADVTKRMADGMAEFVDKDLGEGTQTVFEYNRYCYYVAGLVGEGLTRLFHACGYESAEFERKALDPSLATNKHGQVGSGGATPARVGAR